MTVIYIYIPNNKNQQRDNNNSKRQRTVIATIQLTEAYFTASGQTLRAPLLFGTDLGGFDLVLQPKDEYSSFPKCCDYLYCHFAFKTRNCGAPNYKRDTP